MIVDLEKFIGNQRQVWKELEEVLGRIERNPSTRLDLDQIKRLHLLYGITSADLARLQGFAAESELKLYLEALVSKGFCEIHDHRSTLQRFNPVRWATRSFPQVFRARAGAFWIASAVMLFGCFFGVLMLSIDPEAKEALMPFEQLLGDPSERVAREELKGNPDLGANKPVFSSTLMTHNIRVSILCMAMGVTLGMGTLILLFYNGVLLGAVAMDYIHAGQTSFLLGWLLPHGVIEIPAILVAGQAGLLLGSTLMGGQDCHPLSHRLQRIVPDLTTLMGGVALMLVWAGIVEAFFSQYHEPVLPYALKIAFGALELTALTLFLSRSGSMDSASEGRSARAS